MEYTKENAKLFRNNPVFSGLDDHELGQILAISKRIEYSKDDLVFSEDMSRSGMHFVYSEVWSPGKITVQRQARYPPRNHEKLAAGGKPSTKFPAR